MLVPAQDTVAVNLVTRLLLQPRLAAVGHGLVERLQVFEGGTRYYLSITRGTDCMQMGRPGPLPAP